MKTILILFSLVLNSHAGAQTNDLNVFKGGWTYFENEPYKGLDVYYRLMGRLYIYAAHCDRGNKKGYSTQVYRVRLKTPAWERAVKVFNTSLADRLGERAADTLIDRYQGFEVGRYSPYGETHLQQVICPANEALFFKYLNPKFLQDVADHPDAHKEELFDSRFDFYSLSPPSKE